MREKEVASCAVGHVVWVQFAGSPLAIAAKAVKTVAVFMLMDEWALGMYGCLCTRVEDWNKENGLSLLANARDIYL